MKIPGLRWIIAGLLFIETFLAYLDLQELSVLAPILSKELGIGNKEYAFITQAFLAAYTVTFLLGGLVIDRLGVRVGLGLSLFLWSTANVMHALAHNGTELAAYRFLLGLFYPGAFLAAARAVSEWYPPQERALVYGIYVGGASIGAVVAYPMVIALAAHWSWRAPFLVTGGAGLLLSLIWVVVYRRPEHHPWVTDRERDYVNFGHTLEKEDPQPTWNLVVKTHLLWAVGIGRFIGDTVWMFYVLWMAKFLVDYQGLTLQELGQIGWIPFLFADIGSIGGGWLSGWMIRRGVPTRKARVAMLTGTTVVRAFTVLLAVHYSTPVLLILMSLLIMSTAAWGVNLGVLLMDKFPGRAVATAAGITIACGTFSTVFSTGAIAWIVQNYSYRPVFVLLSVLSVVSYIVVRLILRADEAADRRKEGLSANVPVAIS